MNTVETSSGEKQDLFNKIFIVAMILAVLGGFVGVFHLHSIVQEQKKQALEAWESAWARYAETAVTVEQKKGSTPIKPAIGGFFVDQDDEIIAWYHDEID